MRIQNRKMTKKSAYIIGILLVCTTCVYAQRTCVIADMETHKPVRDALIMTDTRHAARTNLYGYFEMKYAFDSATVSHPSFLSRKVKRTTLPDTVFLLKKTHLLQEVTIYGVDRQKASLAFMKKSAQEEGAAHPPVSSASATVNFDFASMLDKRRRHDKKQLKKMQKIFQELDAMDDPLYSISKTTPKKP